MTDSEFTLGVGIFMLLAAFQQFRIVRLRRKIERFAEAATERPAQAVNAGPAAEYDELRKRVQVLERIATEGSPTLERELEELRRAG